MPEIEIRVPQLGEGLQEARILRFLKQPGEPVARDEPLFEMETDKAVMEIESPAAGVVARWEAQPDDVLPIGTVIGAILAEAPESGAARAPVQDVARSRNERPPAAGDGAAPPAPPPPPAQAPSEAALRAGSIPPRTRAHARELGVGEAELARLAASLGRRVLPEDVDRLAAGRGRPPERGEAAPVEGAPRLAGQAADHEDMPLPPRQRTLAYRLQQGTREVIPATMEVRVEWAGIESVRDTLKSRARPDSEPPSQFLLFAWCVAQSVRAHPAFRSTLLGEGMVRRHAHLNMGIAVARPGDELLMALVPRADALSFPEFVASAQDAIRRARAGEDQASESMQLSLTNMAGTGVRLGIPVVAAPAVGTLFIGEPFPEAHPLPGGGVGFRRMACMVLTFDHRMANGVGAAAFLGDIRRRVAEIHHDPAVSAWPGA